jgi:hypothetical protein
METTNKVVEVIEVLCEKFGIIVDWTSENIIPYAQNLMDKVVSYQLGLSILLLCLIPLLTLGLFFAAMVLHKKADDVDYDMDYGITWASIILWALFIVGCIASLIIIIVETINIITCVTFPEKVFFDYIASMIGG